MSKKKRIISLIIIAMIAAGVLVHFMGKKVSDEEFEISLPETRSFYLGFTPFPYDISLQAVEKTYEIVGEHGDLITHHFDTGVPWPEAFEETQYHPNVEETIRTRLERRKEGQKLYLAVTPINGRSTLTGYWAENEKMERPGVWKDKDFDDPNVIKAYINFCRHMIQKFNPDFMAYGIEVNILANSNPAGFKKFLILAEQVYTTLKEESPTLPIFLSIQIEPFLQNETGQREAVEKLLPFTDYIAISSYPFFSKADPKELPENWFSQMAELAPEKPFAVAETGFIAEDLVLKNQGVTITGNERWQAEYVQFLLIKMRELNAKFVVWFISIDYDLMWTKIEQQMEEWNKIWRDTGLIDGNLEPRLSIEVWDAWLNLAFEEDN